MINKTPKRFITDIISPACNGDEKIIEAFLKVPRSSFVDTGMQVQSYDDKALPIGFGQTISQPSTVARMLMLLDISKDDVVLEIGSGSGFVTSLLANMAKQVYAVERLKPFFEQTRNKIRQFNIKNALVTCGDGVLGWREFAPFNKIIASAGATTIPEPLKEQLSDNNGIMVIPVKNRLIKYVKNGDTFIKEEDITVNFVDFVGS